ncbi:MAG TPA: tetratricopeptide repeat protein [Roseiflexaceae bacterium]|nr:tetratricopeptide repeat protein [Roseiflexaceae bacterium]
MKRSIEPNISTQSQLAQLRALLDDTERRIVEMHKEPAGARDVIRSVDEIERRLAAAREAGLDVRAEEGRADFLRRRLTGGASGVVRLVQAADLADSLAGSPTWQAVLAAREAESARRVRRLLTFGLPLLVVLLGIIVLTLLFPPPPQANLNSVRSLAQQGQVAEALAAAQAEAARVPSDPHAHLWVGALQLVRGDRAAAEAAWAEAQRLFGDDARFFFERGSTLAEIGRFDEAEADAQHLIADPRTAAPGYLLLGGIEEGRGRVPEAVAAFERAADIAHEAGNAQLEAIAKARLGILMQSGAGAFPTPTSER